MHVHLTHKEMEEAVREWLSRRGIEAPKNEIKFHVKAHFGGNHRENELVSGVPLVDITDIEAPIKDGPYR